MAQSPSAFHKAIQYLAIREHSELELRHKLADKEYSEAEIQAVLTRLIQENLLSNQRFGEAFVRAKTKKGYGYIRISYDLKAKGLTPSQIEQSFEENAIDWDDLIEQVWSKKYSSVNNSFEINPKEKMKQWRFLQYRGFSASQISSLFHRMACTPEDDSS